MHSAINQLFGDAVLGIQKLKILDWLYPLKVGILKVRDLAIEHDPIFGTFGVRKPT